MHLPLGRDFNFLNFKFVFSSACFRSALAEVVASDGAALAPETSTLSLGLDSSVCVATPPTNLHTAPNNAKQTTPKRHGIVKSITAAAAKTTVAFIPWEPRSHHFLC